MVDHEDAVRRTRADILCGGETSLAAGAGGLAPGRHSGGTGWGVAVLDVRMTGPRGASPPWLFEISPPLGFMTGHTLAPASLQGGCR